MKFFTTLFLLILLSIGNATMAQKEVKKADREYATMRYRNAIPIYLRALKKDAADAAVVMKLADCLFKIRDYQNALRWHEKAVQMAPANSRLVLPYAQLLAANGQYSKAALWYEKYLDEHGEDEIARNFLDTYMHLDRYLDSSRWTISFLNINTGYDEFSPSWWDGGLVFVSNRPRTMARRSTFEWDRTEFLTLYYVRDTAIIKEVATPPEPEISMDSYQGVFRPTANDTRRVSAPAAEVRLTVEMPPVPKESVTTLNKQLESKFHEGPVTFNSRGDTIFMSRNNIFRGKVGKDKKGVNRLKIYSAVYRYGDWKDFTAFKYNSDEYSVGHPVLNERGDMLYFVSDMPGGFGGIDIWYCRKTADGWSAPVNAGRPVNTKGNEMFPYVSKDGILYFSSDGHGGLGGLDVFCIRLKDGLPDGTVANLGYPVNSSRDDFGWLLNKDGYTGYFSSNRCGSDDLYHFKFTGPGYPSGIITPPAEASR